MSVYTLRCVVANTNKRDNPASFKINLSQPILTGFHFSAIGTPALDKIGVRVRDANNQIIYPFPGSYDDANFSGGFPPFAPLSSFSSGRQTERGIFEDLPHNGFVTVEIYNEDSGNITVFGEVVTMARPVLTEVVRVVKLDALAAFVLDRLNSPLLTKLVDSDSFRAFVDGTKNDQ
jgi:hypothetical protein